MKVIIFLGHFRNTKTYLKNMTYHTTMSTIFILFQENLANDVSWEPQLKK